METAESRTRETGPALCRWCLTAREASQSSARNSSSERGVILITMWIFFN